MNKLARESDVEGDVMNGRRVVKRRVVDPDAWLREPVLALPPMFPLLPPHRQEEDEEDGEEMEEDEEELLFVMDGSGPPLRQPTAEELAYEQHLDEMNEKWGWLFNK